MFSHAFIKAKSPHEVLLPTRTYAYLKPKVEPLSKIEILVSVIFLLGLYTDVFLYYNETLFVPSVICGLCTPYFLIKHCDRIKIYQIMPLLFIFFLTFVGMLLAPESMYYFNERLKGLIQLIYSTLIGYLFFVHFGRWSPRQVANIFVFCLLIILVGVVLENYLSSFKVISDHFRNIFFKSGIYENDFRDLNLYGQVRPKLFTSEPSHVAKFYLLSLTIWFSLSLHKFRYLILLAFAAVGFFLIRSPVILLIFPLFILIEVFVHDKMKISAILTRNKTLINKTFFLFILVSLLVLCFASIVLLEERGREIAEGKDYSFMIRVTGSAQIAINTLKEYPGWGAGITGKEAVEDIISETYQEMGVKHYSIYSFSSNFLFMFLVYYGFVGGCLFLAGFVIFLNRVNISNRLFLFFSILVFSQAMGAFVGVRTWCYIFALILISKQVESQKEQFSENIDHSKR